MTSSKSALKESTAKSGSDKMSQTSASQTQTGAVSGGTMSGDYAVPKKVEYVQIELPDSMMKAIRIIERLLTQTKYHEQHVLYKDYPVVHLQYGNDRADEANE